MTDIPFHPLANIFPLLEGREFEELTQSIKENGQRDKIILFNGMILDGRNRYRACLALGIEPLFREYEGKDPIKLVIDKNINRRHLNETQRAMAGAELATFAHGGDRRSESVEIAPVTQAQAAALVGVSERTIRSAVAVKEHGINALKEAARHGKIAVSMAAELSKYDPSMQKDILAKGDSDISRHARTAIKQTNRQAKEKELASKLLALPDTPAAVIVEDYEWDHQVWSRETGMDRHAANHYPVSTDAHSPAEIVARTADRFKMAAADCVLFMWTTNPHLAIALQVMALRGFTYKSNFVWAKDKPGTGYWNRSAHEILLVGTRGHIPCPAMGTQWASLLSAPVAAHSAKPECFLDMIDAYFPTLPKLELNRRGPPRLNWLAWGYEALPPNFESASTKDPEGNAGCPTNAETSDAVVLVAAQAGIDITVKSLGSGDSSNDDALEIPKFMDRRQAKGGAA